jgi:hypothetical protein
MTTIPGYPVGVAFSGGESIGVGLSIPGIYALPEDLTAPLEALNSRINAFRDAATFFVSKSATASDSNDGTSPGEPLRSLGAAVAKANAYVTANPDALCSIHLNPGTYTESGLPYRVRRNICIKGDGILRTTTIRPAAGEEKKGFFKVDSGFMAWGLTFAGHQANDLLGKQSWAISFDELADNTTFGANSPGAYIQLSPYIQNCSSITAAQDAGFAPSTSVGETGGGILVDGKACALNSPIRSMVVDSYTQVNLGGPGCLVINDGYAQLVSFFGTFCTYHVRVETGGQVNLSGGTTDFGTYGLMADGYSPSAIYTGEALQPFFGAPLLTRFGLVFAGTSLFTSVGHGFSINDILTPNGASGSPLPDELVNGQSYFVIADGFTADTFRVASSQGGPAIVIATEATVQFLRSGVLEVDIINFSANRLGPISRPNPGQLMFPRLNYPSAGTLGSPGNPATVATVSGVQFTLNLQSTTFKHEWSGGGTITVGGSATYPITSLTYDFGSGLTTITAAGYTPQWATASRSRAPASSAPPRASTSSRAASRLMPTATRWPLVPTTRPATACSSSPRSTAVCATPWPRARRWTSACAARSAHRATPSSTWARAPTTTPCPGAAASQSAPTSESRRTTAASSAATPTRSATSRLAMPSASMAPPAR